MIDRYTEDALACYGRLRRLDPADARAELELFNHRLEIEGGITRTESSPETGPLPSGPVDVDRRRPVPGLRSIALWDKLPNQGPPRWARTGKISAIRTLGGHRRVRASEIRRFLPDGQAHHVDP